MRVNLRTKITVAAIFLVAIAVTVMGQTTQTVTIHWTGPTTGSPVDHYIIAKQVDGGAWENIGTAVVDSFVTAFSYGHTYIVRVAAVDAHDPPRQGVWSTPSDPWRDDGAPGTCSKPTIKTGG